MYCLGCEGKGYIVMDYVFGLEGEHPTHNVERCDECGVLSNDQEALEKCLESIKLEKLY